MGETFTGRVEISDDRGEVRIVLSGPAATMFLGGGGRSSQIVLHPEDTPSGEQDQRSLASVVIDGHLADIRIGGNGRAGDIRMHPADPTTGMGRTKHATVHLGGQHANLRMGGHGEDGDISLFHGDADPDGLDVLENGSIQLNANGGTIRAGGNGADGDLRLTRAAFTGDNATERENAEVHLEALRGRMRLGGNGTTGKIALYKAGNPTIISDDDEAEIFLDANSGDIRLGNADLAEEFTSAADTFLQPGMVVVLDDDAHLRPCDSDAAQTVVGIVAGAGCYRPGIVLDHQRSTASRVPVAMVGKAACMVDASARAVRVGDLLVTAATPGHARAIDPTEARPGTVLGKALGRLDSGSGLVPVLVSLQ